MEERIIKLLSEKTITYRYWEDYFDYCMKSDNIELINVILNANVIILNDANKELFEIKKCLLSARMDNLSNNKIKTR